MSGEHARLPFEWAHSIIIRDLIINGFANFQLCFISSINPKERKNGHNDEGQPQDVSRLLN